MFDTFDAIYLVLMTALMSWVFDPVSAVFIVGVGVIATRLLTRAMVARVAD